MTDAALITSRLETRERAARELVSVAMRVVLIGALVAGCYKPTFTEGLPCSEDNNCPEGQTCELTSRTCNGTPVTGDGPGDGPVTDAPHDAPALDELVLALAFEEAPSQQVSDLSGNNNNAGVSQGTVMFVPVKYGNGALFMSPFNGALEIDPSASLDIGGTGSGLTVSGWFESNMPDSNSYGVVFEKRTQSGAYVSPFVQFGFEVSSDIYAAIISDEDELSRCEFTVAPGLHHFAWTYDDTAGFSGFLDGAVAVKKAGGCVAPTPLLTIFNRTSPSLLGISGSGSERFVGKVDNLRVYRRVLTPQEIVDDMNTAID